MWIHRLSEVDSETHTAVCAECGPVSILWRKDRGTWRCAVKDRNRDQERNRPPHNSEVRGKLEQRCALCGKTKNLVLDHDHHTGYIRDMLCYGCNNGLGQLGDDPERLRAAADYIERHAARTDERRVYKGRRYMESRTGA